MAHAGGRAIVLLALSVLLIRYGHIRDQACPLFKLGVAAGQGRDMGLREHRHFGELETGQRLGWIEQRIGAAIRARTA